MAQTYEGRRELFGEEPRDVLVSLTNLGAVCHNMGDYPAGIPTLQAVMPEYMR